MLQRMNELATQSANGTNSNTDRKAIQDEIDQLTTEIDRVSETTKFNETYLLKGDGAEKAHNVNAHDAGLDGVTLTDKGDTVDVTLKTLNAGDKISIAGKNYSIGSTADEAKKLLGTTYDGSVKATINGTEYTLVADGAEDKPANKLNKASIEALVVGGATVEVGGKKAFVITDKAPNEDGIDDNDSTVITAGKAYQLQTAEIVKASSIGTDTAAEVNGTNKNDNYTTAAATFTLKRNCFIQRFIKLQPSRRCRC